MQKYLTKNFPLQLYATKRFPLISHIEHRRSGSFTICTFHRICSPSVLLQHTRSSAERKTQLWLTRVRLNSLQSYDGVEAGDPSVLLNRKERGEKNKEGSIVSHPSRGYTSERLACTDVTLKKSPKSPIFLLFLILVFLLCACLLSASKRHPCLSSWLVVVPVRTLEVYLPPLSRLPFFTYIHFLQLTRSLSPHLSPSCIPYILACPDLIFFPFLLFFSCICALKYVRVRRG